MMKSSRASVSVLCGGVVVLLVMLAGGQRDSEAQAPPVERDPLGPVRCYEIVVAEQLSSESAIELCSGAISDAPGRCFAGALNQFPGLTEQKVMSLCQGATSLQPLDCYARLDANEDLTEDQLIAYCGTFCPVGPAPPEASNPACLDLAVNDTDLALQSAGELCAGSSSAGPVACFAAGQDLEQIADSSLITLCRERFQCQYNYNAAPGPGYNLAPGGAYGGY
jgi:hypothetical protein